MPIFLHFNIHKKKDIFFTYITKQIDSVNLFYDSFKTITNSLLYIYSFRFHFRLEGSSELIDGFTFNENE